MYSLEFTETLMYLVLTKNKTGYKNKTGCKASTTAKWHIYLTSQILTNQISLLQDSSGPGL